MPFLGYLLGGPEPATRPVLGLGTAQRNPGAALAVAGQNFQDPDVIAMIMVVGLLGLVLLGLTAGEFGKRSSAEAARYRFVKQQAHPRRDVP